MRSAFRVASRLRALDLRFADGVLSFVGANQVDLLRGGRSLVEAVGQPFADQATGKLDANHPLAEAEHLGVVGQDGPLHRVRVVSGDRTDPRHFVRRDGGPCGGQLQRSDGSQSSSCRRLFFDAFPCSAR